MESSKEEGNVQLCGAPYTLPGATIMAVEGNKGMLVRRKEAKSYGTRKLVEGVWKPEQDVLYQGDLRLFLKKRPTTVLQLIPTTPRSF